MDGHEITTELLWLDNLYSNLSAHLANLAMIEKTTSDHQTRLQLITQRRAIALDLMEIKTKIENLNRTVNKPVVSQIN